jgi:hypothetical protein
MRKSLLFVAMSALFGGTVVAGCAADFLDSAPVTGPATCHDPASLPAGASTLDVSLKEWSVTLSRPTVAAGLVNIVAHNDGTMTHELLVFRGNSEADLPHNADGSLNEDLVSRVDTTGEISEFDQGTTCGRTYKLSAGHYVLLCNIVEADVVHLKNGMVATLTVTT